jgi:hypothetical protein
MKKRTFIITLSFMFIAISIFQFSLNYKKRIKPPSTTWSKEVLISSGNINTSPNILKFNESYLVAHNDLGSIKLLSVDNLGIKNKEKTFSVGTGLPTGIEIFTDNKFIYLSWFISDGNTSSLSTVKLDSTLNLIEENKNSNVIERVKLDDHVMAMSYEDRIEILDLKSKKTTTVKTEFGAAYMSGTKLNDEYIVSYMEGSQGVNYFRVKNGLASDIKLAGKIVEWTRIRYMSSVLSTDGKNAYMLLEYKYLSEFTGQKLLTFSLSKEDYMVTDYVDKINDGPFYNPISFKSNTAAKFLISAGRVYEKKSIYTDILEVTIDGKTSSHLVPLSRSRQASMYPAVYNDTAVFCDYANEGKLNVYMVSSREDFKNANNSRRVSEAVLAFNDTLESLVFSIVYLVVYGSLWILPSICIASIASIFEYKLPDKKRKFLLLFVYSIIILIKGYFVHSISFEKYASFLPQFITFPIGASLITMISIPCFLYAYKKYTEDLQHNVVALSVSLPLIIDSLLTLYVFVPFIK